MDIIADSGSTKTDWIFQEKNNIVSRVQTQGINPFFRTKEDIKEELSGSIFITCNQADNIYFHGAGIVNKEKAEIINDALQSLYSNAKIEINSDLIGAARATCGNNPGIVCILGTGSNACYFNGQKIVENIPPMGYILGDEGSGTAMGKALIGDYFKNIMPHQLREKFQSRFKIEKDEILDKVYRQPAANKFLASFAIFLSEEIEEEYCQKLISQNLQLFIRRNVLTLDAAQNLPIHFVGSLSFHFSSFLKEELSKFNLNYGKIIKEPIVELANYYSYK